MKKIFLYFILTLGFMGPSYADFQDGEDAYNNQQYKIAFKEFKPLAEQGNAAAQLYLGYFYIEGLSVSPNVDKAFYWFEKAANQGHPVGQWALGLFYAEGESVSQNDIKALEWLKKSSIQGYSEADKEIEIIEARLGIASTKTNSDELKCEPGFREKNGKCIYVSTILNTNLKSKEIILINNANFSGQKKSDNLSIDELNCKSNLIVTKGGSINIKQTDSKKSNKVSSYSDGYTEETNQRYFDLKSKIRNAKYELEDNDNISSGGGGSNALAFFTGVAIQLRHNQIRDEINALENELRNTNPTIRQENIVSYNITQDSVSFEKTQKAKWMLVNCETGEVEINQLDASDTLRMNFYRDLRSDDSLKLFASQNKTSKNKLKKWSEESILYLYNNKSKNTLISNSNTEVDNDSLAVLVNSFLSNE
jgi:TPR repeat protein